MSAPAYGVDLRIDPHVDYVRTSLITEKTHVTFGYTNFQNLTLDIPYGVNNYVTPFPRYRFQPLRFMHWGRYNEVFTLEINPGEWIEWRILSQNDPLIESYDLPSDKEGNVKSAAYADTTMGSFFVDANSTFEWGSAAKSVRDLEVGTKESGSVFRVVGGDFVSTSAAIGSGGRMEIAGGAYSTPGSLQNSGTTIVSGGRLSAGTITNALGGISEITGGTLTTGTFVNRGHLLGNGGTLKVTNFDSGGSMDWQAGRLEITGSILNSSNLRLTGGTLAVPDMEMIGPTGINWVRGTVEAASGDLSSTGGSFLGQNPNLGTNQKLWLKGGNVAIGTGTYLNISPGANLTAQSGENQGTIYVSSGTLRTETGGFTNHGMLNSIGGHLDFSTGMENHGTLNLIDTTIDGGVRSHAGSRINVASGVVFNGGFTGAAAFTGSGTTTFHGGYSPGDSPALVTHEGSITLTAGNQLVMEIGGTGRGSEYDALEVGGTIVFGGNLTLQFLAGYLASEGDAFDLFDWGVREGEFQSYDLPELSEGLGWDRSSLYDSGEIRVVAIPEPSGMLLVCLSTCLCFARRRR